MALRPEHSRVPAVPCAVCRAESAPQSGRAHTPQSCPETGRAVDLPQFLPMAISEILVRHRSERIPRPATLGKHTFGSDDLVHTPARPRSDPARPDPLPDHAVATHTTPRIRAS